MKLTRLAALLVFCLTATLVRAEISPEKQKEIETMLKLTGMEQLVDQMMRQMLGGLRQQSPQVPAEFWEAFSQKISGADLLNRLTLLYDKYYSIEDLQAVNAFYASPAGQRMIKTMPQIMQESMMIGQEWGREIGEQAAREVKELQQQQQTPATDS